MMFWCQCGVTYTSETGTVSKQCVNILNNLRFNNNNNNDHNNNKKDRL